MAIVKRKKERGEPLSRLHNQINDLFGRFFEDWPFMPTGSETWWAPVDLADEEDKVIVEAEVPGVDPKEIDISVADNILTICGEKKERTERKEDRFWHIERSYGTFRREVRLPSPVNPDAVEAEYHDGVLTVTLPKSEATKAKRIEVKTGAEE